jgi:hypothetical protein
MQAQEPTQKAPSSCNALLISSMKKFNIIFTVKRKCVRAIFPL